MESSTHKHEAEGFVRYLWHNFVQAKEAKERVFPILLAVLSLAGWILRCLHSAFPGLPLAWTEASWADYGEKISVAALVAFFVLWIPYRRHRKLIQEHKASEVELRKELSDQAKRLRPRFSLSCGMDISGCCVPGGRSNLTYYRLRVENLSEQQGIDGCTGTLVGVSKDGRPIHFGGSRTLPFAPSHHPDAGAKTLLPKVPHFIDVISL